MNTKRKINLSIVFPAYNEEGNIALSIKQAVSFAEENTADYEIIVVNDGSKDATKEIVESLIKSNNKIKLINHKTNCGYGQTLKDGLDSAKHEWVFFTDSDGQFDIKELLNFFQYLDCADFIVGRRRNRKDPFVRKLNAKIFNFAVRLFFGIKIRDIDCAFKLMRKDILERINLITTGAMINTELVHKAQQLGARFIEVDVTHYERIKGNPTGAKLSVIFKAIKEFILYKKISLSEKFDWLKINVFIIGILALFIVLIATYWSYQNNVILAYGDAEARINIAKRVFHSLTPGLTQLGGVWLPLPQVLMLPFVWNDFLWRTGLAGSIVSIASFVWSAVILYKLSYKVTKDKTASYIAPLIWITNPNSIYLASTPMSEILLFATISTSLYYLIEWVSQKNLVPLILSGVFGFFSTLVRYDGWFLICIGVGIVAVLSFIHYKSIRKGIGNTIVYTLPAFFGIFLWLLWNQLIFGNFLFFANSEYSSKAQQMWFYERGYLPTYKNLPLSFIYYIVCAWLVVGPLLLIALVSALINLFQLLFSKKFQFSKYSVYLLFLPLGFYTISLYTGQASLILPTFAKEWYQWVTSNVRYGIQMLLPTAIFVSMLVSQKNWIVKSFAVLLVVSQFYYLTYITKPIVYVDGTSGLSSQRISKGEDAYPVEKWISKNYDTGLVIMDDYIRPISPVASGIRMDRFINVGTKPYWEESLDNPSKYADWIIIQKASTDAFWNNLTNKDILEESFSVVFRSGNIWVYKKNTRDEQFATKHGQKIFVNDNEFYFYGANIYDLANTSRENVDILLNEAAEIGIQVVRIWGFNKQSTLTQADFKRLDYVLNQARSKGIKLIVVFGNQWSDFGGRKFFVEDKSDLDSFYTDPKSIEKYKKHIHNIVTRVNSINGIMYKDDSTILAWELINEPRLEDDKSGEKVLNWVEEISKYVQLIDPNHMVSVGTEGFMHDNDDFSYSENHDADFRTICKVPSIDICSTHLYPKYFYNKFPEDEDIENLLEKWQNIAEEANKPFYLGEVGFDLSDSFYNKHPNSREKFFKTVSEVARRKNINGALLWNLTTFKDEFFSITPFEYEDRKLLIDWTLNY